MHSTCVVLLLAALQAVSLPQDFFFPEDPETSARHSSDQDNTRSICNSENFEVYWAPSRSCAKLLESSVCPKGQWLVWKDDADEPQCSPRPCPETKVFFEGTCKSESTITCPYGNYVVITLSGEAICDCQPGYVFWGATNVCYPVFHQGPCKTGEIISVTSEGKPFCSKNPCGKDGEVQYEGVCAKLGDQASCPKGVLAVEPQDFYVLCSEEWVEHFQLINTPTTPCPRGSRRDLQGACRKIVKLPYQG